MRNKLHWLVAATLGLSSAAFLGCERNASTTTGGAQSSNTAAQDGKVINNKEDAARTAGTLIPGDQIGAADLTKIYGVLGNVAEDALDKGDFDDLVGNLTAADRDRIGKQFASQTFADLDGRVDQVQRDFKAKYNGEFDLDESKVFENWAKVQKTGGDADKTMVNVMIPASHGMPALTVPMVKDNQAFRIDLPDQVTGDQLKQNLLTHLTEVSNMKDQWPADKLEAQRAIVHHILMGVTNTPSQK
jgi:hypothetical protein